MLYTIPEKKEVPESVNSFEELYAKGVIEGFNKCIDVAKPVDPTKIRFRAKRIDNGEEVVGYYIEYAKEHFIIECSIIYNNGALHCKIGGASFGNGHEIDPSTLTVEVKE
jgi:hypothetical protein